MASKIFKGKKLMQHSPVKMEPKTESFKEMQNDPEEHVPSRYDLLKNQPVSPYRLFMEQFMKDHEKENYIEADRKGFEKWNSMSNKEQLPYIFHAIAMENEYVDDMLLEAQEIAEVSDEADSAKDVKVEKVDDEAGSA